MLSFGPARMSAIGDLDPFALPIDLLFPGRSIETLRPHEADLAPHHVDFDTGRILLGVQSHLLQIGTLTILIDTCIGEHKPRPLRADWNARVASGYLDRLAAVGLSPDDIDIVMCTHLHADHIGWNTRLVDGRWVPTFGKARYLIGRSEFDHWRTEEEKAPGSHNHGSFSDSVMPLIEAGCVDLVEDGYELCQGLNLIALPGHTGGQLGLCLCHQQQQAFFCADALHSPVQVFHPDWATRFCTDPQAAIATRRGLLARAVETGALLIPAHLRHFSAMRILFDVDGIYRPEFVP
jgi:glyoxylase-like metal-dependent hydrolase (beta-lactamase superfamily II)